jgi:hypothetical protein
VVEKTPIMREKPYLAVDKSGRLAVMLPALRKDAAGHSWGDGNSGGATAVPIDQFYIARSTDTAATINAALEAGKHLLLTPGVYELDAPIRVERAGTVVLGLGYPTLAATAATAAMTVADHIGRDINNRRGRSDDPVWAFVKEMNELARVLGMKNTRFLNPHGLELPKQEGYSTAADMAKLSIYAMRRPAFAFFVRQKSRTISVGGRSVAVNNTNQLIGEPGILGIKTGQTSPAGPCLATSMDKDPLVLFFDYCWDDGSL